MWKTPLRCISGPFAVATVATLSIACGEPTSPFNGLRTPADASFARSDGTNGGAIGFNWISPITANLPSYPGTFDPARSVVIEVCKWVSNACSGPLVANFSGAQITATSSTQSYRADWTTTGVTAGQLYRIRVLENGYELGFADAKKPNPGESVASLTAAQIVPLGNSSFLQIKFRLAVRVATQMAYNAGDAQTATAGSAVATAPSVIVKDANNQPLAGVNVVFAPASGGGSVTGGSATTNASGIATVGSWTLGTTAGTNTLTATSTGLTGSPVTFTATGAAGAAASMTKSAGDAQTANSGANVAALPSVHVTDANGNAVSGVGIAFSVVGGGGSATALSATTNASGDASVGSWTLGAGGASCTSVATIANCTRNRLRAVVTGGGAPAVDFVANIPPIVPAPKYQAIGNALLTIPDGSIDLLSQSYSINGADGTNAGVAAVAGTLTGSANGTTTLAGDGSFTYLSTNTITSGTNETFTFAVTDGIASSNTNATLTVNVPSRVVYVQPGYSGTSTGTLAQPYKNFGATAGQGAQSTAVANDVILVLTGNTTAVGGTLKSGQTVYGQGASADYSWTAGSVATYRNGGTATVLLTGNATAPRIGGLTLSSGNTFRGFTMISGTLTGTSFGTLTVSETVINTNLAAMLLNTGALSGSFTSVSSTSASSGTNNLSLTNVSGTMDFGSGGLSGATGSGSAFFVSGGSATLSYSGSLANASALGFAARITGRTGGTITLSGNINSNSAPERGVSITNCTGGTVSLSGAEIGISTGPRTGVELTSNTGAAISFTPSTAMQLETTSGTAFLATGGGTVNVTGSANTISTSGGIAVNMSNTTIGASGITFQSIATTAAANSITLSSTGAGTFTVTGDGASDETNTTQGRTTAKSGGGTISELSGGSLSSGSGTAVSLTSTGPVVLRNMTVSGAGGDGITASSVASLTLDNVKITGKTSGNGLSATGTSALTISHSEIFDNATTATNVNNVRLNDVAGTNVVNYSVFKNGKGTNFYLKNTSGTASLNSTGSAFMNSVSGDGLATLAYDFSSLVVNVQSATFSGNTSTSIPAVRAFRGETETGSFAALDVTINGSTFNNNTGGGTGLFHGSSGAFTANVTNNSYVMNTSRSATPIYLTRVNNSVSSSVHGVMTGTVSGNTIGTAGVAGSGSTGGDGISVDIEDSDGVGRFSILGNTILAYPNSGISLHIDNAGTTAVSLDYRIEGNQVSGGSASSLDGFRITNLSGSEKVNLCLDIGGATTQSNSFLNAVGTGIFASFVGAGIVVRMPGLSGSPASFWASQNTTTGSATGTAYSHPGVTPTSIAACNTP